MAFLFPKVVNQIPKKGKIKKKNLSSIVKMINIFEKRIYHKNLFHPHQKKLNFTQNSHFIYTEINYTKLIFFTKNNSIVFIVFLDKPADTYFCRFSRFCL